MTLSLVKTSLSAAQDSADELLRTTVRAAGPGPEQERPEQEPRKQEPPEKDPRVEESPSEPQGSPADATAPGQSTAPDTE